MFTQIMYHPASGTQEFCALKNVSDSTIELWSWQSADTTWRVQGIGFEFPAGISVAPGERLYLTNYNPEVFRNEHLLPASTQIFQYTGSLNNDGEFLGLYAPDNFDTTQTGAVWAPQVLIDGVRFNDASPWPASADGGGDYLQRSDATAYGNDPANWQSTSNPLLVAPPVAFQGLEAYPNPTSETLNIRWNTTHKLATLRVRDVCGRLVHTESASNNAFQLDVSAYKQGIYFFEVEQISQRYTGKFVVH